MSEHHVNDRDESWGATLAFWGALLIAGGLLAAVALAPKLETLAELKLRYAENQHRLVALETQANELQSVADALEDDPAFASELAKLEFAAGRRGDESIAVAEELRLGGQRTANVDAKASPTRVGAISQAMLSPLANHRGLRVTMLVVAGCLVLMAFLIDAQASTVRWGIRRAVALAWGVVGRYRRV